VCFAPTAVPGPLLRGHTLVIRQIVKEMFGPRERGISGLEEMLADNDRAVAALPGAVHAVRSSPARHMFSEGPMRSLRLEEKAKVMFRMVSLLPGILAGWRLPPKGWRSTTDTIDTFTLSLARAKAETLGAVSFALTHVPQDDIFQGKAIPYTTAIVFTVEMDAPGIALAPSLETLFTVMATYSRLGTVAGGLAAFLRACGISACTGAALGGQTDYPALAELAGLGARGRHGLLITPAAGPRQRIGVVYAGIRNLPAPPTNPHTWVREFCARCGKCVRKCPVHAIREVPLDLPGGRKSCVDGDACRRYFDANYGCSVCIKVCPFSTTGYEKIAASFTPTVIARSGT
jgi:epoxyqueuosine reductase